MGAARHLGIRLRDYDALIRTFIPHYDEMLDAAAAVLRSLPGASPVLLDLGIGSGALAARCLAVAPGARTIGIDSDPEMLELATKRLGARLTPIRGDFMATPLPRCDAVTSSLALHHVRTRPRKALIYLRCHRALRRGGLMVNADCCVASDTQLAALDHQDWRAHLMRRYSGARSDSYFRAWAKDDEYRKLEDEIALMRQAGFSVDVPWRRGCLAVIAGRKR